MYKVFAIIPARSGSKGVSNKNIRNLKGRSLIEWSIKACQKSRLINEIYLSTDSEEYRKLGISLGAKAPFLRPKEISQDNSTDYEMIKHFLDWLKEKNNEPNYLVHIRPTSPLRDPIIIDEAILNFIEKSDFTSLRSVHIMSESSYKTFEINSFGELKTLAFLSQQELDFANKPRQCFPNTYIANGYVDVLKCSFIRKFKCIHGNKIFAFQTNSTPEVDCEEDLKYLDYLVQKDSNIYNKIFNN